MRLLLLGLGFLLGSLTAIVTIRVADWLYSRAAYGGSWRW